MVQRRTVVQLLAVLALISLASCARKGKTQTEDPLIVSMQDSITTLTNSITTLTNLLTQQTHKLNEANLENEQLKMDIRTEFSQKIEDQASKCTEQINDQSRTSSQEIMALKDKLNEANLENEQLKMNLSNCTTTGLIKDLRTEFSQQIEALKDKLAGSENNTTTKLDELREEAARAENSTTEKIEDMKYNVSVVTSKLGELKHEVAGAQNSTTEKIEEITTNLTMVTSGVEDLVTKVSEVEDVVGTWPKGAYCILGSGGSCPTGFTRHSGQVQGIRSFSTISGHLIQATFGDSRVACAYNNCRDSREYKADIFITACCK